MPAGAWIVVKRDHDWIDRKFLNWPHTTSPEAGVEVVVGSRSRLEALVLSGEGPAVEFQVEVPGDREGRRRWARTVAAFANGDGGSMIFGVRDEDGAAVGLADSDATQARQDAIVNVVRSLLSPLPVFSVERIELGDQQGRAVLVLTIDARASRPYGIEPENPRYYVRRGATTFPASSEELRPLARSRPPADQRMGLPYRGSGCV